MLGDSINTFAMMGSDLGNITTRNVDYLTSNFKLTFVNESLLLSKSEQ